MQSEAAVPPSTRGEVAAPVVKWADLVPGRRYRFVMRNGAILCATFNRFERAHVGDDKRRTTLLVWSQFLYDDHELFAIQQSMPLKSVVGRVTRIEDLRQ